MSLNTDDLKKFEQGVPEKISLSGSFDRNVPRNIRLMTSSAEYFRIDSAEKKLSVCLDWRCTLRKNIIEFMGVVVQATLLISIGYSWFYALLIAGIVGIGGLLYFRFQHQSLAKLNIPCVQVMEMQNGILRLFKNDDLIFMQQDTDFREFDLKDIQCFLCVAATTIYYNHTQWKNDAVWKILYAVRQDSTLECIMFTGDCGTTFYRILAKKCGKKLVTLQHSASFTGGGDMKKFFLIISCLGIYLISRYTVQELNRIYTLEPAGLFILLLNWQTVVRLFLWISIDKKFSNTVMKILTVNYLLGFFFCLVCTIGIVIHQFALNSYKVITGGLPLGLFILIGSIFVLHGVNYLLLFPNPWKKVLYLVLSYVSVGVIQIAWIIVFGIFNAFVTSIFLITWTILLSVYGIKEWKNNL